MKIDFYTHTHKKQRKQMYALATRVGDVDFNDAAVLPSLETEFKALLTELRNHAYHEETFVHPLLMKKYPTPARNFHHEHNELKIILQDLEDNFSYLQSLSGNYPKRQEQGLEFYRFLNRFIAIYLVHINEEEYVMQNLWEIAADPELRGMMIAFQVYDGVEKGKKWLVTNLPNMNADERILMFKTTQTLAPEKIFQTMGKLTEEILGNEQWQLIQKSISV